MPYALKKHHTLIDGEEKSLSYNQMTPLFNIAVNSVRVGPWLVSDRRYRTRDIYDTCAILEVYRSHVKTEINSILKNKKKKQD